jgi:putative transposase
MIIGLWTGSPTRGGVPNTAACLRLIRALAVEMRENWIEATRYLNMEYLKEHKKELMRRAA